MKIISAEQMAHLEKQAVAGGSSAIEFMEEAGSGTALIVQDFVERFGIDRDVLILAGKGNNGGDAYVTGIHLVHLDYHVVAYQLFPLDECSELCRFNAERFKKEGGEIRSIEDVEELELPSLGIIVDGIVGTGFRGSFEEPISNIIDYVNTSGLPIISIDIPSGLNGNTGEVAGAAIMASETAFLGLPKTGFFLKDGWNHVGKLRYIDFGLPEAYVFATGSDMEMLDPETVIPFLPKLQRNRHKYQAGDITGLAGSLGMPGAAHLSSLASLRGGAGLIRLLHPEGMQAELSNSPYEVIKIPYLPTSGDEILHMINCSSSAFIGPGLGMAPKTRALLKLILPKVQVPTVIDADALNIIAEEDISIPVGSILTPHRAEMFRLLHLKDATPLDLKFLRHCQHFAEKNQITLVLKGGPTFIFHPGIPMFVNPTGDPGMATAGTGDVLTGLLASLLAQGVAAPDAARLGVYLHGLAGEHAALEKTSYCMIASDLLDYLPAAFAFEIP